MTRWIPTLALLFCMLSPGTAVPSSIIHLATTTSTENSGLLQHLLPQFEREHDFEVKVIPVGTGKALRLLREGDVDAVLVHARRAEDEMLEAGFAVERRDVMYNDFIIVGPADDPAGVRGTVDAAKALSRIAAAGTVFVSRGDDSGTHQRERALWDKAGLTPAGSYYREIGQGMGKTLQISGEMQGYTLTDRGTWLSFDDRLPLEILVEGDPALFNPYGIMATSPERYPDINFTGAMALIKWMTSTPAQYLIANYTVDGRQLFVPMPHGLNAQAD